MPGVGRRNPDWEWDEIVLACDLVAQNSWRALPAENPQVIELSELLQQMTLHPVEARRPNFRNPNGVGRKTADIATHHPQYSGRPTHGNALDEQVMARFLTEPDVMHAIAESIRVSVANGEPPDFPREVGYDDESEMEGRYLLRWHAYRERKPGLRRRKIESVLRRGDPIVCEVCKFDFERYYGERGRGYIECHHVEPLHVIGQREVTIRELALLCSNCHRMIHTKPPWLTLDELREIIQEARRWHGPLLAEFEVGMGFSVKLAPGVRIRASSHGIRAGIGPRVARVHVGTGRTGFSSGVGPISFYTAMGHKRRRPQSRVGKRPPSAAAFQRQAAAARRAQAEAEKAREAQHLAAIFNEILQLHRQEFAPVERPIAPPPSPPNEQEVRAQHEKTALHGIGLFQRSERSAAKQRAAISAQAELAALWQQAQAEAANWQGYLDAQWSGLVGNDPETVLATLAEAFEDNEAPAAPIGVDRAELSLVVLIPPESAVPERMPTTTQAGNLTLRKLPKGERSQLYGLLAAGHVLVTLRETFAVAPGIQAGRVIALRSEGQDVYGRPLLECILAGRWTRAAFDGVRWQDADAMAIMTGTASELIMNVKRGQILPLDLTTEPEIAAVLASIDTAELLAEETSRDRSG